MPSVLESEKAQPARRRSFLFPLVLLAAAAAATAAQSSNAGEGHSVATMSVRVNVVNLLATVRDKHGKIVSNLGKDDFELTEDGRAQTLRYFTGEADLPLTLGLLVDTSLSQRRVLDQERSASHDFLRQVMRADKDKAFVIHFDREVELLQDLTSSAERLESALGALQAPQFPRAGGSDPSAPPSQSRHGSQGGGGTLLYDAVYLASDELPRKQQGRKAVIILPMAWTGAARKPSKLPSRPRNGRTPWLLHPLPG